MVLHDVVKLAQYWLLAFVAKAKELYCIGSALTAAPVPFCL